MLYQNRYILGWNVFEWNKWFTNFRTIYMLNMDAYTFHGYTLFNSKDVTIKQLSQTYFSLRYNVWRMLMTQLQRRCYSFPLIKFSRWHAWKCHSTKGFFFFFNPFCACSSRLILYIVPTFASHISTFRVKVFVPM